MPPHHPDDPSLTAAQERAVRDLLASARHDDGIPEDVAARLDARLAELTAVRRELRPQDRAGVAPVVPLAARRRRRVATGLVAAAAVVVLGIGLGQVLPDVLMSGSSDFATSTEAGDAAGGAHEEESGAALGDTSSRRARGRAPEPAEEPFTESKQGTAADRAEVGLALPRVDPDELDHSARRIRDRRSAVLPQQQSGYTTGAIIGCDLSGPGRRVLVHYDGAPAVLVFVRPGEDSQLVRVLACGSGEVLRSTRIPVR